MRLRETFASSSAPSHARPHRTIAVGILITVMNFTMGCGGYRYTFKTTLPASDQTVSETRHMGFYGWTEADPFDLEQACPTGVAEFGSRVSFLNWIPTLLTLGLYTPRTVYAVCARKE